MQRSQIKDLEELDAKINAAASDNRFDELAQLQTERAELTSSMQGVRTTILVIFGIVLALVVGFVIIGGIRRIGAAAEKLVPSMCMIYIAACLWIIFSHIADVPDLVARIFMEAFTGEAFGGGVVGVMVLGIQRAAFSNEAGVGSAAIAHSAAKTEEPRTRRSGCTAWSVHRYGSRLFHDGAGYLDHRCLGSRPVGCRSGIGRSSADVGCL